MSTMERAVVVGGSITGLGAAATLATHAREVVVVERRPTPLTDGSVAPQGHLPHVMLVAGNRVLEDLFPGFAAGLLNSGAHDGGTDPERLPCHWRAAGTVRGHLRLPDLGFPRALCSRALIETRLRSAVLGLPNVTALDGSVDGLRLTSEGRTGPRVTGVRLRGHGSLEADLVVDASGRSSRTGDWLDEAGLSKPPTTEVVVDLRYTAFFVERRPEDLGGAAFAVIQNTSDLPRIGVALPMEGARWQVVLGGYFGDAAPTDPAGAREFARSLADPTLDELVARPHLVRPSRYTFRSSLRRHWERLPRPPHGLCVLGDAVASFNPIYGQGMSSALLQVEALRLALGMHGAGPRLAAEVARSAAKVVDNPWLTATGADFLYPRTQGRRPPGSSFVNRYVERVTRAAAVDETVNAAFTGVQQLLAAPPSLFRPGVVARAVRYGGAGPRRDSTSSTVARTGATA